MSTRVRWLGHSALLVESDGLFLLIDPFLTNNPAAAATAEEVQADFIVVSHGHGDHIEDAAAIAERTGATVIGVYELVNWLQNKGVQKSHPMNVGGSHRFPFGRLKLTQAHHSGGLPDGTYGGCPAGVHLFLNDGSTIYDAADTALFGDMRLIGEEGVDLAFLPIGDNYTMGPDDSIRAIKLIEPSKVAPIHYNTWEPIAQDPHAWADRVRRETQAEPVVVPPGGWIDVR